MEYLLKPWAHQVEAIERAKTLSEFGLFFEMGTGKTMTAINIARHKFAQSGRVLRTLILCPPIVVENWRREWAMNSKIDPKKIIPLTGPGSKRLKEFTKLCNSDGGAIFITNYEALLMKPLFEAFMAWKPELFICDELHKLKDMKSKRTKAAVKLADESIFRLGLTGTPVLNSPMDLFAQFRVLDKGETFGKNFFRFRAHYFYDHNAGMPQARYFPDWRPRTTTYDDMNKLVYTKAMRVKKDDCLDLPPLVRKPIFIGMDKPQAKAYHEMKQAFITYIQDKAAVADLAITKALRLQQIVSGFVKLEDDTIVNFPNHPRRVALKELLEELAPKHKVIVWAVFKENYKDIRGVCDELGIKCVEVHGEISDKDKLAGVDAFNTDESVRVLFGHPGSGGIGINLVVSDVSIFYSRNFSLEQDLQAEARNYRGGSERHQHVTRIDLVTPGTIDEQILEKLSSKVAIGEKLLKELVLK
jgi:SNF2 family DNA or RNA helicase